VVTEEVISKILSVYSTTKQPFHRSYNLPISH